MAAANFQRVFMSRSYGVAAALSAIDTTKDIASRLTGRRIGFAARVKNKPISCRALPIIRASFRAGATDAVQEPGFSSPARRMDAVRRGIGGSPRRPYSAALRSVRDVVP